MFCANLIFLWNPLRLGYVHIVIDLKTIVYRISIEYVQISIRSQCVIGSKIMIL